jgi:transcriptional regulator with XRE-family HTH domain
MQVERTDRRDFPGLGDRIRRARQADERSLIALAAAAGMTPTNWYRIEDEDTKVLPLETLRRIERVLGVDLGVTFPDLF